MADRNIVIKHKNVILCEGRDELKFLNCFLRSIKGGEEGNNPVKEIDVFNFDGINDLNLYLKAFINTPGFNMIENLLIIRDAERSVQSATDSIKSSVSKNGMSAPKSAGMWQESGGINVGFLLFPQLDSDPVEGTLEDLCLKIIKEDYLADAVLSEIEDTMGKLKTAGIREFPHEFKTKLHSFFSLTDRFVGLKIGEAADAGAFDWDSPELDGLRKMITR